MLALRGITFDVGTEFWPGDPTRRAWRLPEVRRDLQVIRDELGCNSVALYGTLLPRIIDAARIALGLGLHVALQLRTVDQDRPATLERIRSAARAAHELGAPSASLLLNLGCEISLFTHGFLPGRGFLRRMRNLVWSWPWLAVANPKLARFLDEAVVAAKSEFAGPVTYSSGSWESVDWRRFDFVGVDLYRERANERNYVQVLREYFRHGKPVLITEFGCCCYDGAERLGGAGWLALDYTSSPPVVRPGYTRNERVQAETVGALLDLYRDEGVHGAYVYDFVQSQLPHHEDPRRDLDMAGYGVVKASADDGEAMRWERKPAFEAIAARYRSAGPAPD